MAVVFIFNETIAIRSRARNDPDYAKHLLPAVVKREDSGVWIDTERPAWLEMFARYGGSAPRDGNVEPHPHPWPLTSRLIAKLRAPGQVGLGDTVAANPIVKLVGWGIKRLKARCGCAANQAYLNARFPY